ncbi:hypothetical protein AX284_07660 [Pseudomonas sp. HUK17]|nr:hypothetical protein AX284_07660 [Pseudomonas sp. HUK17]SEO57551.1 hypothetical protein SAMN02787149_101556 [Pseudomonas sp. Snoq117.2]
MSVDVDVALMNQSMLLQVLKNVHNGIFAVMVIENFTTQARWMRVIQAAQDFSFEFCIDSHVVSSYVCKGYDY